MRDWAFQIQTTYKSKSIKLVHRCLRDNSYTQDLDHTRAFAGEEPGHVEGPRY